MELREQRFWDETVSLAINSKIPFYPATRDGLIQAVRDFLTEQGSAEKISDNLIRENRFADQADTKQGAWLEYFLGDALLWAQDCSVIQPITDGLADALRLKFHPNLPPEQIECLYALPNTTHTNSGLRFSNETQEILRKEFLQRRSEAEQKEVVNFILDRVEKAKPDVEKDNLAYLSWEAVRERVRLEVAGDNDLKRFGELLHTPLAKSLGDSLTNYGFDTSGRIPLLTKPKNKRALQRLSMIKGNPFDIKNLLSRWHKVGLALLIFCVLMSFSLTTKNFLDASGSTPRLEIAGLETTSAHLEIWDNDKWKVEKGLVEAGQLSKVPLLDDRKYRLILYGNLYHTIKKFTTDRDHNIKLSLAKQDTTRKCIEKFPGIGLVVETCPESFTGDGDELLRTWKERLGDKAPKGRVMSVGLEFADKNIASSDLNAFRKTLLETGSIDILYRIQPDSSGNWQIDQALSSIRMDLAPWIQSSQLIWWEAGQPSELIPEDAFSEFARVLKVGKGNELSWVNNLLNMFESSNDIIIDEQKIILALGKGQAIGIGPPLVLMRSRAKEILKPEKISPAIVEDTTEYTLNTTELDTPVASSVISKRKVNLSQMHFVKFTTDPPGAIVMISALGDTNPEYKIRTPDSLTITPGYYEWELKKVGYESIIPKTAINLKDRARVHIHKKLVSQSIIALIVQASKYLEDQEFDEAIIICLGLLDEEILSYQANPKEYLELLYILGVAYFKLNDHSRAVRIFEKILNHRPSDHISHYNIALSYYETQKYRFARIYLDELIKLYSRRPVDIARSTILKVRYLKGMCQYGIFQQTPFADLWAKKSAGVKALSELKNFLALSQPSELQELRNTAQSTISQIKDRLNTL